MKEEKVICDRFEIAETISQDRAYRAFDRATGKDVFLKCWRKGDSSAADEISMLTVIDSPYAPGFIASFQEEDFQYLAEEWIEGVSLDVILDETGPLDVRTGAEITEALCDALSFLHWHKKGAIVYLDLKPSNIIVRGDIGSGNIGVTLVDYESARRLGKAEGEKADFSEKRTRFLGSMYYSAPEIIFGEADERSDIYSLGILLWVMLKGSECLPKPSEIKGKISGIIRKATAPKQEDRYGSITELKEAVRNIRSRTPGRQKNVRNISISTLRTEGEIYPEILKNFRRSAIAVDSNTCFACELAEEASAHMELKTGLFSFSYRSISRMNRFLSAGMGEETGESSIYLFDNKGLYMRTPEEWTERRLLNRIGEKLYVGTARLLQQLPMRKDEDYEDFFEWCFSVFDIIVVNIEKYEGEELSYRLMKECNIIIATPQPSVDTVEEARDYYTYLAENNRIILPKVRYAVWDYRKGEDVPGEKLAEIVGKERYLGEVIHSADRNRRRNMTELPEDESIACEGRQEYGRIIERLIG